MSNLNILICGGGVAGPACAFFLARAGANVTVVERSPQQRRQGQNIDLRGEGQTVVQRMGLEKTVRACTTTEKGMRLVDSKDNVWATLEAAEEGSKGGASFTSDIEILRGELVGILIDATKDNERIKYVFGDRVDAVRHVDKGVEVDFKFGKLPNGSRFDLIIAADGQGSRTRDLVFGSEPGFSTKEIVKPVGQCIAYFTIPRTNKDSEYARGCMFPGRRALMLRPDNHGTTRALAMIMGDDPRVERVPSLSTEEQKNLVKKLFSDAGWEADRILRGMELTEDFYMHPMVQVRMPFWSKGHATVLGDAGYSPSRGLGTTLALCGAYILAGELSKSPDDVKHALAEYERVFKPHVVKSQTLLRFGMPKFLTETKWGVWLLQWATSKDSFRLPEYSAFK